jgi:hypothetical protein
MAVARTQTFDQRAAILDRLVWRNRWVAVLRIAVPAVGVLAFVLLMGQIWLASMTRQYGVSGLRIDRGNLVVETPQYTGIGADGSRYVVKAREARTPLDNTSHIDMTDATLDYTRPGKPAFHATGTRATMDTTRQFVTVPGVATLNSDDGMHGTLADVESDIRSSTTTAQGPVDMTFEDGSNLKAANMHYDGKKAYWVFERVTLLIPNLPHSNTPTIPFFNSPWVIQ